MAYIWWSGLHICVAHMLTKYVIIYKIYYKVNRVDKANRIDKVNRVDKANRVITFIGVILYI